MPRTFLSGARRRCAASVAIVVVAAGCTSGGSTSNGSPPSRSDISAVLAAAKRGIEALETIDCTKLAKWQATARQATTGIAAAKVPTRAASYRKTPSACPGPQQVTVLKTALTGLAGNSARVVQVSRVTRTGAHPVHGDFASQTDVDRTGGRWLVSVESDSRAPLSADLSWATPDVRAAVRAADRELTAIFRQSTEHFTASSAAALKGLTGAARQRFQQQKKPSLQALRRGRLAGTNAKVTALGVETTRRPAVLLLANVHISAALIASSQFPAKDKPLEVTMSKLHGEWLISDYRDV